MSLERIVVFLVAENCLLRESLVRVLRKRDDLVVAGAIAYSDSALEEVLAANPDVVLFDSAKIALSGYRAVSRLREAGQHAKIVLIGMEQDESTFLRAVAEGVLGYVLEDATAAEHVRAIRAVASGEAVCPPRYSSLLFQCAARDLTFSGNPAHRSQFGLSRREQQLLGLIRQGLSNKEIAACLNLSEQTVKNHIHRMLRKVGARDRLHLVKRCQSEEPVFTSHDLAGRGPLAESASESALEASPLLNAALARTRSPIERGQTGRVLSLPQAAASPSAGRCAKKVAAGSSVNA